MMTSSPVPGSTTDDHGAAACTPSTNVRMDSVANANTRPAKSGPTAKEKAAYHIKRMQQVEQWSAANYGHFPCSTMKHVSMNPPVYQSIVTIDEQKGLFGVGKGPSKKTAENQAMEALYQMIQQCDKKKDTGVNCPIKDPSTYKHFRDGNDAKEPWSNMVKNYVDSFSILHTRQRSQIDECIEWDGRLWITLKINVEPILYGRGVHIDKNQATVFAAIQLARQLDAKIAEAAASGRPALHPVYTLDCSEYIASEPGECIEAPWLPHARNCVQRVFMRDLKREPLFQVSTMSDASPVRYMARVVYDDKRSGNGQGLSSKEAIRLACVDLCCKLSLSNEPVLREYSSRPIDKTPDEPPLSESRKFIDSQDEPATGEGEHELLGENDHSNDEAWLKRPKFAVHEIFLKHTGQTPLYKLDEDREAGTYSSSVRLEKEDRIIIGRGSAPSANGASFLAALDFCRKYFSTISIGDKRTLDSGEVSTREIKLPFNANLDNSKAATVTQESIRPIGDHAEFAIWLFDFLEQRPIFETVSTGPAHILTWKSKLSLWLDGTKVEGIGSGPSKKESIGKCVSELARVVKEIDPSYAEMFAAYKARGRRGSVESPSCNSSNSLLRDEARRMSVTEPGSVMNESVATCAQTYPKRIFTLSVNGSSISFDTDTAGANGPQQETSAPTTPAARRYSRTNSDEALIREPSQQAVSLKPIELPLVVNSEDRDVLYNLCDPKRAEVFAAFLSEHLANHSHHQSVSTHADHRNGISHPEFAAMDKARLIEENQKLLTPQSDFCSSPSGNRAFQTRLSTALYQQKGEILDACAKSNVTIINGPVDCGMAIQMPKIILEQMDAQKDEPSRNMLAVVSTRIEAMVLASHVAEQIGCKLGERVGFSVGSGEECQPELCGSVLFTTVYHFCHMIRRNHLLAEYSHVILDGISSRSIEIDLSLYLMREIMAQRPEFRLIVLCKNVRRQLCFLDSFYLPFVTSVVHIDENMVLPEMILLNDIRVAVKASDLSWLCERDINTKACLEDNIPSSVPMALIEHLVGVIAKDHSNLELNSGIMVILPSYGDILALKRSLSLGSTLRNADTPSSSLIQINLIHPEMRLSEFKEAVKPTLPNTRRILLATDLIETGFARFPNVGYVIDCGVRVGLNTGHFSIDPQFQGSELNASKRLAVDQSSALKRCRQASCKYYLLLSKERYELSKQEPAAESLRLTPDEIIISVLALLGGSSNTSVSELLSHFPEPPQGEAVNEAVKRLTQMSLITSTATFRDALPVNALTPLGDVVSRMPLPPNWARFLIGSIIFRCLDPGLLLCASAMAGRPIIYLQKDPLELARYCSDHYAVIIAYNRWQEARPRFLTQAAEERYCLERGLDLCILKQMERIKNRLFDCLDGELGVLSALSELCSPGDPDVRQVLNENSEKRSIVRGLIVLAHTEGHVAVGSTVPLRSLLLARDGYARISADSFVLNATFSTETGPGVFVYDQIDKDTANGSEQSGRIVGGVSRVPAMAAALLISHSECNTLSLGKWIDFNYRDTRLLLSLRSLIRLSLTWLVYCAMSHHLDNSEPAQEARGFAIKVIQLASRMIRHHSSFEQ